MGKKVCLFGELFREVRKESGRSQWDVSVKAATHLSNVHQIEAGHQEPRILVAMRLVVACGADIDLFFSTLAERMSLGTASGQRGPAVPLEMKKKRFYCPSESLEISGYGDLLRYCRSRKGVSQKILAEKIKYDLRSLQRVERGEQEPLVTSAVKLVAAIDIPPGEFFACLWFFLPRIG